MKQQKHVIVGIHITNRMKNAGEVQNVLTLHGRCIKTRLGLHEIDKNCEPNGIIILEVVGSDATRGKLMKDLGAIKGVDVQQMVFTHPGR